MLRENIEYISSITEEIPEENIKDSIILGESEKELGKFEIKKEEEITSKSKTSQVLKYIKNDILPAVFEGSRQAMDLLNNGIDYSASALNYIVPVAAGLAVDSFLPSHLARPLVKKIELATKATTFVGKNVLKAGINVFTFGVPAWADAFRQHLAVSEGNKKYKTELNSQDFLAMNYIDHLKDEKIKVALNEYFNSRNELTILRNNPEKNLEKIKELSKKIASYEVNYKNNIDFTNLKSILEKGKDFMDNNEALISEMAIKTADQMISNVENFYKNKFGKHAKEVKGKWLGIITSPEKGRDELVEAISKRLKKVMSEELSSEDVQLEIKKINKELFSKFGVYRKYLKAGIFTLLRFVTPIPEWGTATPEGESVIAEAFKTQTAENIKAAADIFTPVTYPDYLTSWEIPGYLKDASDVIIDNGTDLDIPPDIIDVNPEELLYL